MEKYLEDGELTMKEIKDGLRARTLENDIVLVTCGSAFKNKGVQAVLDAVIEYMPSPTEVKAIEGDSMRKTVPLILVKLTTTRRLLHWRLRSRPTPSLVR